MKMGVISTKWAWLQIFRTHLNRENLPIGNPGSTPVGYSCLFCVQHWKGRSGLGTRLLCYWSRLGCNLHVYVHVHCSYMLYSQSSHLTSGPLCYWSSLGCYFELTPLLPGALQHLPVELRGQLPLSDVYQDWTQLSYLTHHTIIAVHWTEDRIIILLL